MSGPYEPYERYGRHLGGGDGRENVPEAVTDPAADPNGGPEEGSSDGDPDGGSGGGPSGSTFGDVPVGSGSQGSGEPPFPAPQSAPSAPPSPPSPPTAQPFDHLVLKSLLGAWALSACSAEETAAVEGHLSDCGTCAEEALRLRDAVALLHPEDSLDLDPSLRSQVLEGCMGRRAPRVPVPEWAAPYDAETSRLDALLRDMADAEWRAPVPLRWFDGRRQTERETTVAGVIAHLLAVDGLVAAALGMPDPLDAAGAGAGGTSGEALTGAAGGAGATAAAPPTPATAGTAGAVGTAGAASARGRPGPDARTEEFWRADCDVLRTPSARVPWRRQGRAMVRTASFAGGGVAELDVVYGDFTLPVRDALLDRAFECWIHAEDIADAVDYPYTAPQGKHMHRMVDLAARMLPATIAWRRRTGLAGAPHRLTTAGAPGRSLHLEVEGDGGGDWYIPLDSPAAAARPSDAVAHVALDRYEFCQLVAGRIPPLEAAAGHDGDREAVRDVLFAAASLSRM